MADLGLPGAYVSGKAVYKITLDMDGDLENPADMDCNWRLYSFSTRHLSFKHPAELGLGEIDSETGLPKFKGKEGRALKRKLENGLAHILSYYEHGSSAWFRKNEPVPAGVEFQWDGRRVAGLLVWEHDYRALGAKTFEERAKDADGFLRTYNDWANGQGYWYAVHDPDGELVASCGGFYASDVEHMFDHILDVEALHGNNLIIVDNIGHKDELLARLESKRLAAVTKAAEPTEQKVELPRSMVLLQAARAFMTAFTSGDPERIRKHTGDAAMIVSEWMEQNPESAAVRAAHKFTPGDPVLVRQSDDGMWQLAYFAYAEGGVAYCHPADIRRVKRIVRL
jgi:hypothetical protein